MAQIAESMVQGAELMVGLANLLCEDIPDEKFAFKAIEGLAHPAFIMGHIAMYAEDVLDFAGRSDLTRRDAVWEAPFAMGTTCSSDASLYPSKQDILRRFNQRYAVALAEARKIPDEVLLSANDTGKFEDRFSSKGGLLNFALNGHPMMHLGQISAWRRSIGLGSVL